MQVILFNVKHSRLTRYTSGVIASGSYQYLKFQFNFHTDDWKSTSLKTANFQYKGKSYYVDLDDNNQVFVPAEVLHTPEFKVSLFGGGMTTQSVRIPVQHCGLNNPENELEPEAYYGEVINKLSAIVDTKADNLVFNEEDNTIQLAAGEKIICDKVPVGDGDSIDRCYIDENGDLIVCLRDGGTINAGHVVGSNGEVYVPHIDKYKVLTFTVEEEPTGIPDPVDLNPNDEWSSLEDQGTTEYIWNTL